MFLRLGVIPAGDMTIEAAVTKLMHVLAQTQQLKAVELAMLTPLRGELTTSSSLV
jgi:L-asparaginase/Glu-tRNA(Gln) amidotransferase subunit D